MMQKISFDNLPEMVGLMIEKLDRIERQLNEQGFKFKPEPSDQFLTVKQAADFLNLAVPTVYSAVSKGELPHMKRSKRLYFDREELKRYLKNGRQMTNEEIEQDALDCLTKKRRG